MFEEDYSRVDKILHRLALGHSAIARASFDVELLISDRKIKQVNVEKPVFVTGLARSGTTMVLELLFRSGVFRSLTYRDMPFVLAPSLWRFFSGPSRPDAPKKERAHGDGVLINPDSPEAFEEVFWRVLTGDQYIMPDRLVSYMPDNESMALFPRYLKSLLLNRLRSEERFYLSKNNNNLLRLGAIRRCLPDARLVVPFRHPVQHAISLHRQHMSFTARHRQDAFSLEYMNWLGHHEFGMGHRPFCFDGNGFDAKGYLPDHVGYWLAYWIYVHKYISDLQDIEMFLFDYDEFCRQPKFQWKKMLAYIEIEELTQRTVIGEESVFNKISESLPEAVDEALVSQAMALYKRLKTHQS